ILTGLHTAAQNGGHEASSLSVSAAIAATGLEVFTGGLFRCRLQRAIFMFAVRNRLAVPLRALS
ncbi:MAG: hypothetical protein QGI10_01935, partial [Vicinamibacterales bacterium]|nr:hypothetical protein [Vicinamibacterales bacterium]